MRNIVLIGFMGSGKTTIGRALEKKTHITLVDTDELIEKAEGYKISEIFTNKGEEYFRKCESEILKKLISEDETKIISTGGGIVVNAENISLLKQLGKVFYLRIKPETVVKRLEGDRTRPLLAGEDKLIKAGRLMAGRRELYEKASDKIIDVDELLEEEILEEVLKEFAVKHK